MKFVYCVALFALVVAVKAVQYDDVNPEGVHPDYWQNDYNNLYDYPEENNESAIDSNENIETKQEDTDKQVEAEIQDFREQNEAQNESNESASDDVNALEDYQFEDNRSDNFDKDAVKEEDSNSSDEEPMPDDAPELNADDLAVLPLNALEDEPSEESNEDEAFMDQIWNDEFVAEPEEEIAPLPVPSIEDDATDSSEEQAVEDQFNDGSDEDEANVDQLIEETNKLLEENGSDNSVSFNADEKPIEDSSFEQNDNESLEKALADLDKLLESNELLEEQGSDSGADKSASFNADEKSMEDSSDQNENAESLENMLAGLDKLLETNELLEEQGSDSNADEKPIEDAFSDKNEDDDTPDKVLDDLNADLDKLLETIDKLRGSDSNSDENAEKSDNSPVSNEVEDYEDKYNKPFREGYILSLRDDYDNFMKDNQPDEFEESFDDSSEEIKPVEDEAFAEPENADVDENNNESGVTKTTEVPPLGVSSTESNDEEAFEYVDDLDKLFNDNDDKQIDDLLNKLWRHSYGNDGLVDDAQPLNEDAEVMSTTEATEKDLETTTTSDSEAEAAEQDFETTTTSDSEAEAVEQDFETTTISDSDSEETQATVMVENLNSAEYNDLMVQFTSVNSEILDVNSADTKNVAPIHIALSVDKPTVITSPNYPSAYPTNNITDWIIEGPGTGIEMNVTDFYVNGAMGDYLLVKPGGIDATGTDGLVFSFRLNHERKYRFTNVNRMFVRFEAKAGMQFATGFSFSARMIWPLPEITSDEVPEPEAIIHPPRETLILSLAGLTLRGFNEVRSSFKELIADMAKEYIDANDLYPGLKSTLEVSQITKTAVCNIRWPNYETCVEVTFGVPIQYENVSEMETPRLTSEDLDDMWRTYIAKEEYAARLREMGITEYAIPDDRTVLILWLVIALGVVIAMAMLAFALWRFRCFEDYTRMMAYTETESVHSDKKKLELYPTPHQTLPPLYADSDYKWADEKYDDSTRVDMGGFANKSYIRDDLFDFESDEDIITPRDRKDVISPRDVYEV